MASDMCSHVRTKEEAMRLSMKALTGVGVLFAAAAVANAMPGRPSNPA
jgi:hypothetical protein